MAQDETLPPPAELVRRACEKFAKQTGHTITVEITETEAVAHLAGPLLTQDFGGPDAMEAVGKALAGAHVAGLFPSE